MKAQKCSSFPLMDSSSAVFPTVRENEESLYLAYHLPGCNGSAIISFHGVVDWSYGYPNDEGLGEHRLWGKGLKFYSFHIVIDDTEPKSETSSRWIATFHDGTFEVEAQSWDLETDRIQNCSPSKALVTLLGDGENKILDEL